MNYLGVDPAYQKRGLGRQIMTAVEEKLLAMGCPKINLQVRADNTKIVKFYERIGYTTEALINMGKRMVDDEK